jgi:dTDP-4-amino-4,6-dideoxygalactose transaminase
MIPFNRPHLTGAEKEYISQAHENGQLSGDGFFTKECSNWLEANTGCSRALLTHSCTAALEMAAMLIDIKPGDEVILPSYTFVSTANAFVLRGATPVFVDIREDTLNIDEDLIEAAITHRTKAIVPVHYAGVSCNMERIMEISRTYNIPVIEDAAQSVMSSYKGQASGTHGHLGCYSFHETKNIISGEGGALLINEKSLVERAEIIREKGTNRSKFIKGQVDKYTWVDIGSSFLPGEIIAAFLFAQMEHAKKITSERLRIWTLYYEGFQQLADAKRLIRPTVPDDCKHNAHMFYLLLPDQRQRDSLIEGLKRKSIQAVFHYMPLHNSPYYITHNSSRLGKLTNTEQLSERLVRLPLWMGLDPNPVIQAVNDLLI